MQVYILLGVPPAEELDFLTKLGDVLGKSLHRGHFEGESLEGAAGDLLESWRASGTVRTAFGVSERARLFDRVVSATSQQGLRDSAFADATV